MLAFAGRDMAFDIARIEGIIGIRARLHLNQNVRDSGAVESLISRREWSVGRCDRHAMRELGYVSVAENGRHSTA